MKILLVQLASAGDCLFVTTIAKQIKEVDYPGSELTWLIGAKYRPVLDNNPFIDHIIEMPVHDMNDVIRERENIPDTVERLSREKSFSHIFITDYTRGNINNWFGTTRSSLFRNYPHNLVISPRPIIFLKDDEIRKVDEFCSQFGIGSGTYNILFECSPQSGQSRMTLDTARLIAKRIITRVSNVRIILSSNSSFSSEHQNIIDGSTISWRENAELANRCQLFVGCSSGISWICTSNWSRDIKMIQSIDPAYTNGLYSASLKIDFEYFGMSTSNLLELYNPSANLLENCIVDAVSKDFGAIKRKYEIQDHSIYRNLRFLKESGISRIKKIQYFIRYHLGDSLFGIYRVLKPKWFTPGIWLKK